MNFPIHHLIRSEKALPAFWMTAEPPNELFIQGSLKALDLLEQIPDRGLAIVGTRNPQLRTTTLLKKWIMELENSNLIIISGLARGIDTVAHQWALQANLPTIAILGAGHDIPYPRENLQLRQKILEANGLVVSEFPAGTPALGHHFLRRNRIISGWAKATWVVEAGLPSGALSTARWARDRDQICFAVPSFPGDPAFAGNETLLDRDHALPFWGTHSLGSVWLELATHTKRNSIKRKATHERSDDAELIHYLSTLTRQKGGVLTHEAMDWALSRGWPPKKFFTLLQGAIQKKQISDQQGILSATADY